MVPNPLTTERVGKRCETPQRTVNAAPRYKNMRLTIFVSFLFLAAAQRNKEFMWHAGGQQTTLLAKPVIMTDGRLFRAKAATRSLELNEASDSRQGPLSGPAANEQSDEEDNDQSGRLRSNCSIAGPKGQSQSSRQANRAGMTPTPGRDRRPRSGGIDTRWARPSRGRDDILQRPAVSRSEAEARSCMSSVMRGRSVVMDRPPVCEMVKRHEVWSPNPPAMGNQQLCASPARPAVRRAGRSARSGRWANALV